MTTPPTGVVFTASPNHATLVTSYELAPQLGRISAWQRRSNLGKREQQHQRGTAAARALKLRGRLVAAKRNKEGGGVAFSR